jgi:hypothetical protein
MTRAKLEGITRSSVSEFTQHPGALFLKSFISRRRYKTGHDPQRQYHAQQPSESNLGFWSFKTRGEARTSEQPCRKVSQASPPAVSRDARSGPYCLTTHDHAAETLLRVARRMDRLESGNNAPGTNVTRTIDTRAVNSGESSDDPSHQTHGDQTPLRRVGLGFPAAVVVHRRGPVRCADRTARHHTTPTPLGTLGIPLTLDDVRPSHPSMLTGRVHANRSNSASTYSTRNRISRRFLSRDQGEGDVQQQ